MKPWLAALALCLALPVHAIDRLTLRAARITTADVELRGVQARLDIRDARHSSVTLQAARMRLPRAVESQTGTLDALRLTCTDPLVDEPRFACPSLTLALTSSRWAIPEIRGNASYRSNTGVYTASSSNLQIAGLPLQATLQGDANGMQADFSLRDVPLTKMKEVFLAQHWPLPDLAYTGRADLQATLVRNNSGTTADAMLSLRDAGFQNADYTLIGEKLEAAAALHVDVAATPMTFAAQLTSRKGQTLTGPVLLDLDRNPLQLTAAGRFTADEVEVHSFRSEQRELATVTGAAHIGLSPLRVRTAILDASDIRFPAAYTSYLQIALSTTPFNQLATTGRAALRLQLQDDAPTQFDLVVQELTLRDASRSLKVENGAGELHWTAGLNGPPRPSWLSWESSEGWGIVGARSRLDFIAQDRDFTLTKPARLPFFDGALRINTMAVKQIGTTGMSGIFDAEVEPISVAPIARAMGMPEFPGKLSGRIPGLTYKDNMLSIEGKLEADVFGGKVVASQLRLRDPLGPWPRLYGDVVARGLDLGLITSTFEFGSITGRLDMDLTGLETFNWSPVAFNLRLATPPGDRSRHRINQRAIKLLSDIGGGGGGVAAALQSGALRFFDDFGYDRMGLSCVLRNDICQMSGVEPAGAGFYIVKGSSLPRIDIIGNNSRVAWPQLIAQVVDAVKNPEGIELK